MVESYSSASKPDPAQEARDALAAAQGAQQDIGRGLRYDAADEAVYALAVGLAVLASGLGGAIETSDAPWLAVLVPVMYVAALALMAYGIQRFRSKNGVWISGFSPRRSRWVSVGVVIVMGAITFAAVYAGNEGAWGLVALATLVGAAMAVALGRLWMRVYRDETAAGPRG